MDKRTAKQTLMEEFRLKNLWLDHPHPEDFCACQWRWPSWVFLLYRAVLFLYSLFALIYLVIVDHENRNRPNARRMHHLMVFLTTWTYIVLVLHLLIALLAAVWGAWQGRRSQGQVVLSDNANAMGVESAGVDLHIIATANGGKAYPNADGGKPSEVSNNAAHGRAPDEVRIGSVGQSEDGEHSRVGSQQDGGKSPSGSAFNLVSAGESEPRRPLPWFLKISWVIWSVIGSFAIIVTVIYFTALFPYLRAYYGKGISLTDLNVHAINSCFVFIDAFMSARPVRLLHVVYPMIYGTIYIVFSLIFWSTDMANNVIYPFVLDWNQPGLTVGVVIGLAFVGAPLLQLVHFGLFQLRLLIYRLVYKEDYHPA